MFKHHLFRSVCLCAKYLRKLLTDFDEIFRKKDRSPGNYLLDLVAIRVPFHILSQFFTPVMHFQWDSSSSLLYARWRR